MLKRLSSWISDNPHKLRLGLLKRSRFAGQLHSSLNGGSLEQGGIDGRMAPAPPLAVDTLRDP